ncbi:MAG: lysylphosphatidylglycerol synthase transmembrane domain-containing protein, partial [Bacteroidota bacterium]
MITGLALYYVFSKISWSQVTNLLINAKPLFLILSMVFFTLSKITSALRLQLFFKNIQLFISHKFNLKLAWIGMFYNLFLPGGVGGDGYKVYLLHKQKRIKVKLLIQAMLLDRVSGLVSLLILAGVGFLLLDQSVFPEWVWYTDLLCLLLVVPSFYLVVKILFKTFEKPALRSLVWSIGVQLMQVVSAILILAA